MKSQTILYFDPGAKDCSTELIPLVQDRAASLGISHLVVASTTGASALKLADAFQYTSIKVVCVGEHYGFWGGDSQKFTAARKKELEAKGVQVFIGLHSLSGIERGITKKFGGVSRVEIIAATLRQFGCEGIKVCVEVAVMAADAGLIPTDREVIAVAGSGQGCNTAVVLKPAHMHNFFDLEIREIIAKPRQRTE
jgi:hypothetical protein